MEIASSKPIKRKSGFISKPLFIQTLKASWILWLVMTLGSAAIFFVVNIAIGSKNIFSNIDMDNVTTYVRDEQLSWLQILGLLTKMGFSLNKIQVMSQIDLNSVLNDLVYKIAGVLLPMVFVMITSNNLIAAQVNSGSMAYILSTPTSRKTVVRTQYIFMVIALLAMYIIITSSALASEGIAEAIRLHNKPEAARNVPLRTVMYCSASFLAMFALMGICFGASAFFNKAKYSVAVGGGASIVCFLFCVLGLFGNKVFVSLGLGVQAMNTFNYMTLFTLIDTDSMGSFAKAVSGYDVDISFNWIWQWSILVVVGIVFAYIGSRVFVKKDLPL